MTVFSLISLCIIVPYAIGVDSEMNLTQVGVVDSVQKNDHGEIHALELGTPYQLKVAV